MRRFENSRSRPAFWERSMRSASILMVTHAPLQSEFGAGQTTLQLSRAMRARGHDVTVWSPVTSSVVMATVVVVRRCQCGVVKFHHHGRHVGWCLKIISSNRTAQRWERCQIFNGASPALTPLIRSSLHGDQAARRAHILCSICVHSLGL